MDLSFHHLGVAVKSIENALPFYIDILGLQLQSQPISDPIQKVSVCFLQDIARKQPTIELVEPLAQDSPVNKFLSKEVGAYHLCYEVHDLVDAITTLRQQGSIILAEPVPAVAFNNRHIAWIYTTTRQLLELLERE